MPEFRIHVAAPARGARTLTVTDGAGKVETWSVPCDDQGWPQQDGVDVRGLYLRIQARNATPDDIESLGVYLFSVVLAPAWARVRGGGNELLDLALSFEDANHAIAGLPWEAARSSDGDLARSLAPPVSIRRVIAQARAELPMSLPPLRVLFVVGADLHDERVRAGSEYLGVLRRLESLGLAMQSAVVLGATKDKLTDAIRRFRPSVIHFICHGTSSGKDVQLELGSKPNVVRLGAEELATSIQEVCRAADPPPPVALVLSVCESGVPRLSAAYAALLVTRGFPFVVGMTGEVADGACRLFARSLYEALATGSPVHEAVARGRRAGSLASRPGTIDWALPALFMAEDAPTSLVFASTGDLQRLAASYRLAQNPSLLIGRWPIIDAFHEALSAARPRRPVLVVEVDVAETEVDPDDASTRRIQFGKSRLLEELAAQSISLGCVPCLVTSAPLNDAADLARALVKELRAIPERFERHGIPRRPRAPAPTNHCVDALQGAMDDKEVARAVQKDLRETLRWIRASYDFPASRMVVLLDEVHRYNLAAHALAHAFITDSFGLGVGGAEADGVVPVVIAYSGKPVGTGYQTAIDDLVNLGQRGFSVRFSAGAFRADGERADSTEAIDRLAYQQFLLGRPKPLAIVSVAPRGQEEALEAIFEELEVNIGGIPSKFLLRDRGTRRAVETVLRMGQKSRLIVDADDEAALKRLREPQGGH